MQSRAEREAHHEWFGGQYDDQSNASSESPAKCMGGETTTEIQPWIFQGEHRMSPPERSSPARHCREQQVGTCGNAPTIHACHYRTKATATHLQRRSV